MPRTLTRRTLFSVNGQLYVPLRAKVLVTHSAYCTLLVTEWIIDPNEKTNLQIWEKQTEKCVERKGFIQYIEKSPT